MELETAVIDLADREWTALQASGTALRTHVL
jgi:hypothetical protein